MKGEGARDLRSSAHRTPERTPGRTGKTRTSTGTARAHALIRVRVSDTRM